MNADPPYWYLGHKIQTKRQFVGYSQFFPLMVATFPRGDVFWIKMHTGKSATYGARVKSICTELRFKEVLGMGDCSDSWIDYVSSILFPGR
jgi:hypothetical protein